MTAADAAPAVLEAAAPYRLLSAGRLLQTPATLAVLDPATEQPVGNAPDCSAELLDATVAAAQAAFAAWAARALAERAACLVELGNAIEANVDLLTRLLTAEQGRPLAMARQEVLSCVHWCRQVARMEQPVAGHTDPAGVHWETRRVPLGVVAAVVPWNFPLMIAVVKLAPALLAGNTVIVKPSPFTPLATLRLGELAAGIFPAGVLNVLSGGDALGPQLTAHAGIAKVSFTGSTATGRRVMASAAASLKRLTLELGGNDAAIVLPDVDVARVAKKLFLGAFLNAGQVCIAAKRIYVHASIYDDFAKAFAALAAAAPVGPVRTSAA